MDIVTPDWLEKNLWTHPTHETQRQRTRAVLTLHPDAILALVSDEFTGRRFGQASRRTGKCQKIGHSSYKYQLWASWAPADILDYG